MIGSSIAMYGNPLTMMGGSAQGHLVAMPPSLPQPPHLFLFPKAEPVGEHQYHHPYGSTAAPMAPMVPNPMVPTASASHSPKEEGDDGEKQRQERAEFLRAYGIEERHIQRLLACPAIGKLQPLLQFFEEQGFSRGTIAKSTFWHGAYLKLSKKNISRVLLFFLGLGFPKDSPVLLSESLRCSAYRIETLQERVDVLIALGFSRDEVCWFVRKYPRVLELPHVNVRKKVDFLVHMLNRNVRELLKWPRFLSYSMEKRLFPRSRVIAALREGGLIQKDYSLKYIFDTTDEVFHRRFTSMLTPNPSVSPPLPAITGLGEPLMDNPVA